MMNSRKDLKKLMWAMVKILVIFAFLLPIILATWPTSVKAYCPQAISRQNQVMVYCQIVGGEEIYLSCPASITFKEWQVSALEALATQRWELGSDGLSAMEFYLPLP